MLQKLIKTNWFLWFLNFLHDRSWDRFWINFGSILPPKIRPNRSQERSKVDQKSDRKTCWVWDRFLNDFWSFLGPNGGSFSHRANLKNHKNPSLGLKMWPKPPGRAPRHPKYSKIMKKWGERLPFFQENFVIIWPENQVPRNKDAARWRVRRAAHWILCIYSKWASIRH